MLRVSLRPVQHVMQCATLHFTTANWIRLPVSGPRLPLLDINKLSMAQIPPSPSQPPHQKLPPLLRSQPGQEAVSPLPHNVTRIVSIARTTPDLDSSETGVCRHLAHQIERLGRACDGGRGAAGGGERGGSADAGDDWAAGIEDGHVACPADVSMERHVRRRCSGGRTVAPWMA